MKINKIKINSFGKLKEKEINLENNINLIYGKNESGKSTLQKFITSSLYGISKNKKGKEYSDYEKYTPWIGEEFSGKIEYELDNKKKYEIFRDFKKKNPKIFNDKMEEISSQFNIDKTNGTQFFYDQTKVDEELFMSTVVVDQQAVKLGRQEQNVLVQKIANLAGTGDDSVSFKKAMDRIGKRQLEEIGSAKSKEKPINIIQNKISELEKEKMYLEQYKNLKYEIEENKNNIYKEISELEKEKNILKEINNIKVQENIENEKIKIKENIKNENYKKMELAENEIDEIKEENKNLLEAKLEKTKNKIDKKIILALILIVIINILQFIFIKNKIINYIFLLTVPAFLIFAVINKNKKIKQNKREEKNRKIKLEKINNEIKSLENEINILKVNCEELEKEISNLKSSLILKTNFEKEKIKNNYFEKIQKDEIEILVNQKNLEFEIEKIQNEINNKKLELHSLELDKKNIEPKLDTLSKMEEELVYNKEKMSTLQKNNLSFELAKEVMAIANEEMRNSITPRFTEKLSANISNITNGKYCKIALNEDGLFVEAENGNYIPASKLSVGTIDQLYLSLRLSMTKELSEESLPIILDETFAYYDEQRLENILKYLSEKFQENQIIIFTCTNREQEILEKLEIDFNSINLD